MDEHRRQLLVGQQAGRGGDDHAVAGRSAAPGCNGGKNPEQSVGYGDPAQTGELLRAELYTFAAAVTNAQGSNTSTHSSTRVVSPT